MQHAVYVLFTLGFSIVLNAAEFTFDGKTFSLPDGFILERVAGPPEVNRPISADFDERGRLFVTDSSGSNENVKKQVQTRPHRIVCLEDTTGDGHFNKSTVFADRMMFPEGILCHDGAVYCAAPPVIWKLVDTNGDGIADRRTEWFNGKTLTHCANDLHGPYLGPDGWIYWCKGAFAEQTFTRPGNRTQTDRAAHIFRCRPDGNAFDSVISGGMDNPVEIAFSPTAEAFFSTTFFIHPRAGQRDALVHAIYGSVFPKTHGVLNGLVKTGALMPPLTQLDADVPCGMVFLASAALGADFQGNLLSSQFNSHRIQRHQLKPMGATFKTVDQDFLVTEHPEFHPTDVLEDADGSLLVVDTGGWYKICCPSSQIAKPEVLGAIYRIRSVRAKKPIDPRGLNLDWKDPSITLLDDPRPAVRKRAVHALSKKTSSISELGKIIREHASRQARLNAVWTLTRMSDPKARLPVRNALSDKDPQVRQAAAHSVGLHRDHEARELLEEQLKQSSPHLRRKAAEALGCLGRAEAIPALLAASSEPLDRALEHALIYALIEINRPDAIRATMASLSPAGKRIAGTVLGQIDPTRTPESPPKPPVVKSQAAWLKMALDDRKTMTERLAALAEVKKPPDPFPADLFDLLTQGIDPALNPLTRIEAASLLGRAPLDVPQFKVVIQKLKTLGPLTCSKLVPLFTRLPGKELGMEFVESMEQSKGFTGLRMSEWQEMLQRLPQEARFKGMLLAPRLASSLPRQKERLAELEKALSQGDLKRGHLVFNSSKAACFTCHAIGYIGGRLGPDLTRIGKIRTERDLLEAVVYPDTSFVRGFESLQVKTKEGQEFFGRIKDRSNTHVTLALGPKAEIEIERDRISEMLPSPFSLMPKGMDEVLSQQEIADLIAFLKSLK